MKIWPPHVLARFVQIVVAGTLAASCSEVPTELPMLTADVSHPLLQQSYEDSSRAAIIDRYRLKEVPSITIELPMSQRPWDHDDESLVQKLQEVGGRAMIAFKAPESPRVLETGGERATLSAPQFADGMSLLEQYDLEVLAVLPSIGVVTVEIDPMDGPRLRADSLIDFVEPEMHYKFGGIATSRAVGSAFRTTTQDTGWGVWMIRAPEAWPYADGSGVKVLIIDGGINSSKHNDLPSIPSGNCGSGTFDGCPDPLPPHGTRVAGVMLAADNAIGIIGAAPGISGSNLYSWAACDFSQCYASDIAAGIAWGVDEGIKLMNISLHGPAHLGIQTAVASASSAGALIISIAGNVSSFDTSPDTVNIYPGALANVVAVSGVKEDTTFANTSPCSIGGGAYLASNWGPHVDIAAPFWAYTTNPVDSYITTCGTSFAAPLVTAAAAILWEENPGWSSSTLRLNLLAAARDLGSSQYFGWGLVDAIPVSNHQEYFVSSSGPGVDYEVTKSTTADALDNYYGVSFWVRALAGGVGNTVDIEFYIEDGSQWSYFDTQTFYPYIQGWNVVQTSVTIPNMGANTKIGISLGDSYPYGNVVELDAKWVAWTGGP